MENVWGVALTGARADVLAMLAPQPLDIAAQAMTDYARTGSAFVEYASITAAAVAVEGWRAYASTCALPVAVGIAYRGVSVEVA